MMVNNRISFLIVVIVLYLLSIGCAYNRSIVKTKVSYRDGKTKVESIQRKQLFNDHVVYTDKSYYPSGKKKSCLKSIYGKPKETGVGLGMDSKYSLMLYKKYTLYSESGNIQEKGKLIKGTGKIQEFNNEGKPTNIRKVENFMNVSSQ